MANDITIMKTTLFGGFKKSDVLALVEQLKTESANCNDMLDEKRREALELRNRIDELEEKLEELSRVNELLAEKENLVNELTAKLEKVTAENNDNIAKLADFEEKSEKLRRAEKQIGAAYIDARRYSDDLVDNAKSKAKDIGAIASQDIKREAVEIESLLKEVDSISKKFNTSVDQLHKDIYALSKKLNMSASNLLNIHTDLDELNAYNLDYENVVNDEEFETVSNLTDINTEENDETVVIEEADEVVNISYSDDEEYISLSYNDNEE